MLICLFMFTMLELITPLPAATPGAEQILNEFSDKESFIRALEKNRKYLKSLWFYYECNII